MKIPPTRSGTRRRALIATLLLVCIPLSISVPDADGAVDRPAPSGDAPIGWSFWTGGSVFSYSSRFNEEGRRERFNFGSRIEPVHRTERFFGTHLGAEYVAPLGGGFAGGGGLEITYFDGGIHRENEPPDLSQVRLFGTVTYGPLTVRVGSHQRLTLPVSLMVVSTRNHMESIRVSVSARHQIGAFVVGALIERDMRQRYELEARGEPGELRTIVPGDITKYRLSAAYRRGYVTAGFDMLAHSERKSVTQSAVKSSEWRYLISAAPRVEIDPPSWPAAIHLALAAPDEFAAYGFPLAGLREAIPSFALTVRLVYQLEQADGSRQ